MANPPAPYRDEEENVNLKSVPHEDLQLRREAQDMGRIGYWLGSKENAALYIVGAIILLSMIGMFGLGISEPLPHRIEIIKQFGTAFALALGFIGGLLSGRSRSH